jgi:DNA-binding XRE family transcriptional regulator
MSQIVITIDNDSGATTININNLGGITHQRKPTVHKTGDWEHHRFNRERFKSARLSKGLKQVEIGDLLGMSQSAIGAWEKGSCFPAQQHIDPITEALGISREYLLGSIEDIEAGE